MRRSLPRSCAAAVLLAACSKPVDAAPNDPAGVSLIRLIASPDDYDGKRVRVVGVANWEFEGDALFVSKEHRKHHVYRNSVWLSCDDAFHAANEKRIEALSGRYVIVEGTFSKQNTGHMGMFAGAIEKIDRVDDWED